MTLTDLRGSRAQIEWARQITDTIADALTALARHHRRWRDRPEERAVLEAAIPDLSEAVGVVGDDTDIIEQAIEQYLATAPRSAAWWIERRESASHKARLLALCAEMVGHSLRNDAEGVIRAVAEASGRAALGPAEYRQLRAGIEAQLQRRQPVRAGEQALGTPAVGALLRLLDEMAGDTGGTHDRP